MHFYKALTKYIGFLYKKIEKVKIPINVWKNFKQ